MSSMDSAADELKTINAQIAAMEQQRDEKAKVWLAGIISDKLIFRRANNTVVDKATFIKGLDERDQFTARRAEEITPVVFGDRALVTLIVHATKADGTVNRYRNIRLFSKQPSGWVLEFWHNYDVTSL